MHASPPARNFASLISTFRFIQLHVLRMIFNYKDQSIVTRTQIFTCDLMCSDLVRFIYLFIYLFLDETWVFPHSSFSLSFSFRPLFVIFFLLLVLRCLLPLSSPFFLLALPLPLPSSTSPFLLSFFPSFLPSSFVFYWREVRAERTRTCLPDDGGS